jgi:hypothetical protein
MYLVKYMGNNRINLSVIQNLRIEQGTLIGDCPACAQAGKAGRLRLWETGAFQCLDEPSNWGHRDLIRVMVGETIIQITGEKVVDARIVYPFKDLGVDESFWVAQPPSALGQSRRYWQHKLARTFTLKTECREGVVGTLVTRFA